MTSTKLFRAHAGLLASLDLEIEQASDPSLYEASAPVVSKWSVKDHLEHLSIAHGGIVSWIERARDGDPKLDTGDLDAAQWLRFMVIHHNHHQKIIRDVLEARSARGGSA